MIKIEFSNNPGICEFCQKYTSHIIYVYKNSVEKISCYLICNDCIKEFKDEFSGIESK